MEGARPLSRELGRAPPCSTLIQIIFLKLALDMIKVK